MPKRVARIDGVFSIRDIGTVICMPKEDCWSLAASESIHRRERVQIRKPDGECLSTFIKDIELINRGRDRGGIAFSLPKAISRDDIPDGSELWLERDGTDPLIERE